MYFKGVKHVLAVGLLLVGGCAVLVVPNAWGQAESTRKAKIKVAPAYPELARRMRITGVVKVQVAVTSNGAVKDTKLVGGHPLLANAVLEAVKKWRFEPGREETTETLEFRFDPTD